MSDAPRILVVDDEPNIRRALRTTLEAIGAVVDEADDATSALRAFERSVPNAVILDLRLPGADGLEVLRRMRAVTTSVPVVIVTAHGTVDAAVAAMKDGAYDFLQKPFEPAQIREMVTRMLRGEPPPRGAQHPVPAPDYDGLVQAARAAARDGRLDAAAQWARRAVALTPDRPEAYHVLGVAADLGRSRLRAQVYYRTALAFDPTYRAADANLDRSVGGGADPLLFGDEPALRRGRDPRLSG